MANQFQIPRYPSIRPPEKNKLQKEPSSSRVNFGQVLQDHLKPTSLKFSSHAQKRMDLGRICLTQDQTETLQSAVDKAAEKGSRESLVLMDNLAFVVSVPNRTVITVVDGDRMKENIFTQIDSAVIT